jgi:hypothetical protein
VRARRSVEDLVALAAAVNVRVAIEVIPNPLSGASELLTLIEDDLEGLDVGICLDLRPRSPDGRCRRGD